MLPRPTNLEETTVTVETLKEILEAFNRHDLDAIMEEDRNTGVSAMLVKSRCVKLLRVDLKVFPMFTMARIDTGCQATRAYPYEPSLAQPLQESSCNYRVVIFGNFRMAKSYAGIRIGR